MANVSLYYQTLATFQNYNRSNPIQCSTKSSADGIASKRPRNPTGRSLKLTDTRCRTSRCMAVACTQNVKERAHEAPYHPTQNVKEIIQLALSEDAGDLGDITSLATIPEGTRTTATFLAKADGILAGCAVADMVFEALDPSLKVDWMAEDGDAITKGLKFGTVSGDAVKLLTAERVALNLMQRMSGIATATHLMAEAASPARILDTRKTAPGLRVLDKWAVLIGGGTNHRMGLYDMLLVKDNHVDSAGGLTPAVSRARDYLVQRGLYHLNIELETRTLSEVKEAAEIIKSNPEPVAGKICRVMLDNMDLDTMREAVSILGDLVDTEASGNVTMETVGAIGKTGVNYISSGALTHSVAALDISFNVESVLDYDQHHGA